MANFVNIRASVKTAEGSTLTVSKGLIYLPNQPVSGMIQDSVKKMMGVPPKGVRSDG